MLPISYRFPIPPPPTRINFGLGNVNIGCDLPPHRDPALVVRFRSPLRLIGRIYRGLVFNEGSVQKRSHFLVKEEPSDTLYRLFSPQRFLFIPSGLFDIHPPHALSVSHEDMKLDDAALDQYPPDLPALVD